MSNYRGVIIEESLGDKSVFHDVRILGTKVEKVTSEHQTPHIKQWTLYIVEVDERKIQEIAESISSALETSNGQWYSDFKNDAFSYVIFKDRIFKIRLDDARGFEEAKKHGISLGIPEYQCDFAPSDKIWKR